MSRVVSAIALAAAMIVGTAAQATVTVYTDKTAFLAASGTTQTEDFSAASQGQFGDANSADAYSAVAFNGFSISGNTNYNFVGVTNTGFDGGAPSPFYGQNFVGWGSNYGNNGPTTTLTFTVPVSSFGFDWFNTDYTDQYQVTLSTGDTYGGPPFSAGDQSGFWGVISTDALSYATISTQYYGGYISDEGFDNVVTSADVPEPAMLGLFGMGAIGLGIARRRRAA